MKETKIEQVTSPIMEFQHNQNLFNIISGQDGNFKPDALRQQFELIVEESYKEGSAAFDADDAVELLDSAVDTLFVTLGLLQKLQNAGFDTNAALKKVSEDNLTKFTKDEQVAKDSVEHFNKKGVPASYRSSAGYFVVYNAVTNKVLKPLTFVPTDLSDFCPVKKISEIAC